MANKHFFTLGRSKDTRINKKYNDKQNNQAAWADPEGDRGPDPPEKLQKYRVS